MRDREPIETASASALGALQLDRLRRTLARAYARVPRLIEAHVGVAASVRVVPPETLERSQGKAKRVIDRRLRG